MLTLFLICCLLVISASLSTTIHRHLKRKFDDEDNPFDKYPNMKRFFVTEMLKGIFLGGTIGAMPWYVSVPTDKDYRYHQLAKMLNVLCITYYLSIIAFFVLGILFGKNPK